MIASFHISCNSSFAIVVDYVNVFYVISAVGNRLKNKLINNVSIVT
jgi:hypothetical protein